MESQTLADTRYFRPRRLGHANLFVSDLDRSMDFYKDVVGLEEVYRRPPVMAGFLSNGNTHHDVGLVDFHGPAGWRKEVGLNHIGLELETEVDLVDGYRRAIADGVKFTRTVDHEIAHSVYCADADGNHIEIYADTTLNWRTERAGTITNPTLKWEPGSTPPSAQRNYHVSPEIKRVEDAVFHPLKTTHVVLVAAEYESCIRYYTEIVGFEVMVGGAREPFTVMGGTCGERSLSIFRARGGREPGLHHVGLKVADDAELDESRRRIAAAGIVPEADIDHAARRCIVIGDPDGIRLQFYVERDGSAERLRHLDEEIALWLA